jgi:hypothetical protein
MTEINYDLLQRLAEKPHPLLNIADDFEKQIREIPIAWTGEVFTQARTAHHLLDLAGIPQQAAGHYSSDLDARTWLLVVAFQGLKERLDRIATWHSRETAEGGMVGDFCVDCGLRWPCDTRRMADGSHEDLQGDDATGDSGSHSEPVDQEELPGQGFLAAWCWDCGALVKFPHTDHDSGDTAPNPSGGES